MKMEGSDNNLNALFELAREEAPRLSIEQAQSSFATSLALSNGSSLAHWIKLLNLKTGMIMIGGIVISTLICLSVSHDKELKTDIYNPRAEAIIAQQQAVSMEGPRTISLLAPQKNAPHVLLKNQEVITPERAEIEAHDEIYPEEVHVERESNDSFPLAFELPKLEIELPMVSDEGIEQYLPKGDPDTIGEDDLTRVVYIVNSKTTEEDLEKMMDQAESAGINMSYDAKFRKGKIKNIHMLLTISKEGEKLKKRVNIYSQGKSRFSTNITWRVDKEGRAVDFDAQGETSDCVIKTCN